MSLRIGENVKVTKGLHDGRYGKILDFKWNMIFIEFIGGDRDWVEVKNVRHDTAAT